VKKNKNLITMSAAAMAVATLIGTSAFADSRPANETRDHSARVSRDHSANQSGSSRGDRSPARSGDRQAQVERRSADQGATRSYDRSNGGTYDRGSREYSRDTTQSVQAPAQSFDRNRSNDRNRGGNTGTYDRNRSNAGSYDRNRSNGGSYDRNRSNNNGSWRGNNGSYGRGSYDNRRHYSYSGRISNIVRYGSGYRIWIGGAPYPFFVSDSYYRRNRFRIGINIALGGYYNPLGYYDYDDGYYDGGSAYSTGALRGVVESVDYRRDTFVLRNEATGSFVTVSSRSRRSDVRPGDYVEIAGDWTRSGFFEAYDVALLNDGYRR
jgi:hypothetical protein